MIEWLNQHDLILMEASIVERIRRAPDQTLHPRLVNAPLIYEATGKQALETIYAEYMDIARAAELPLLICTPTWRTNRERVTECAAKETINADAVHFLKDLRDQRQENIRIAGILGCKNDCYTPAEGLSQQQAFRFHAWQVDQLAGAGVDVLMAVTLPAINEALGLAQAMERSGLPYIISFVIARNGYLLDGTALAEAIATIDQATDRQPLGYTVNCAHPTFLCPHDQPKSVFERLIGYQGNASSLDHCDLDGAAEIKAEPVADWSAQMLELNQTYGVKMLGGCCGTNGEHLRTLVSLTKQQA